MSTPILATKLYIPPPRPKAVLRPRLIEQLNEGLHRKLTLISAPAGFGNTTLIAEWVAGFRLNVESCLNNQGHSTFNFQPVFAWLSLDEGDNDSTRFLIYLIAALQSMDANIAKGVVRALQSPQPPPSEMILISLINEIAAISVKIILILDDYHLIEAQPIHDALTYLLEHLPPQMHLVIATRQDPHLP